MKRMLVLLSAVAALTAAAAGGAFAGGGTTVASAATCNANNNWTLVGTSNNLDIPAGVFCYLSGEFKGNVTVEGLAAPNGAMFDGNVTVNGGWIVVVNSGAVFMGNLTITGSNYNGLFSGVNALFASYGPITIHGNLTYTGNTVPLYVAGPYPVVVNGGFTYSGNTYAWDATQPLTVLGQSRIS